MMDSDDLPIALAAFPQADMALAEWVPDVPGLLDGLRNPHANVLMAESSTVTARFEPDMDGDTIPDGWELDQISPDTDIEGLTADGDPDRDGRTTLAEFRENGDPLLYEFSMLPGWNCLGMGATPGPNPVRDGLGGSRNGSTGHDAWDWSGRTYRPASELTPFIGCWVYSRDGEAMAVHVLPLEPPARVNLKAEWNLLIVDRPQHVGLIADVLGASVSPLGWAWRDGTLSRTDSIELRVPTWVKAQHAGPLDLGGPGRAKGGPATAAQ
jgi:hypothetical protein